MNLNLDDLRPQEAIFKLSEYPDTFFTLKKFSLAAQIWVKQRFGIDKIKEVFETQALPEMSEIVFYLLKDKTVLKSLEAMQEAIVTTDDRIAIITALLTTIGISQPIIEKLAKDDAQKGNAPSLSQPTGAQSTT